MHRRYRLTRSHDFDAVYRRGRSVSTRFLVLYWFPREDTADEPRLGLAVPKRVGSAVARNRVKRRLRELWRARLEAIPAGCDYVLVVRPGLRRGGREPRTRTGSASGSTRCSERRPREVRCRSSCARSSPRPGVAGAPTCKYHPSCSAVRGRSRFESTVSSRARRRRPGGCSAATPGATAEWITRDRRPRRPRSARDGPPPRPRTGSARTARSGCRGPWAIVALTVIVRILIVPLTVKQIHSMQNLQRFAPQMKEIQQKYKHDKQKQNEELMSFYKEHKINPAASCLPLLAQLPVFFSLYFVLQHFEQPRGQAGDDLNWLGLINITQHATVGLGAAPDRDLRRQPALVVVLHVDDGRQDPADAADGAAGRSSSRSSSASRPASSSTG